MEDFFYKKADNDEHVFNFYLILFSVFLYNDEFTFYPALKKPKTNQAHTHTLPPHSPQKNPQQTKTNQPKSNQAQKGRHYAEISAHCLKISLNISCVIESIQS